MIFYSQGNEVHFYKEVLPLSLTVKVRVSGSRKWPKTRHILIRKSNKGNNINLLSIWNQQICRKLLSHLRTQGSIFQKSW